MKCSDEIMDSIDIPYEERELWMRGLLYAMNIMSANTPLVPLMDALEVAKEQADYVLSDGHRELSILKAEHGFK